MRYFMRAYEVDAVRQYGNPEMFEEYNGHFPMWVIDACNSKTIFAIGKDTYLKIVRMPEPVKVNDGDWLIRREDGGIIAMDDEKFHNCYNKDDFQQVKE